MSAATSGACETARTPAGLARAFSRELCALYLIALLAGVAIGLFNPLMSIFLAQHGLGRAAIGANASLFFLSLALAAPLVGRQLRAVGLRRTMSGGLVLTGVCAAVFALQPQLAGWFAVRALMGLGVALYMIAAQTALNRFAHDAQRALVSGVYGLAFGLGLGIGPVIGPPLYLVSPVLAFCAGGAFVVAGVPVVLLLLPDVAVTRAALRPGLLKRLSLPVHAVLAYGFAEATLLAIYPVFLLRQGFTPAEGGLVLGAFVAGALIATLPATVLGDARGHRRMLAGCALTGACAAALLAFAPTLPVVVALGLVAGAGFGPVFPLALAMLGTTLPKNELAAGSAWFTAAFGLGSALGPWSSGFAMEHAGDEWVFALVVGLFGLLLARLAWPRAGAPGALAQAGAGEAVR